MRHKKVIKRQTKPDQIYDSILIAKFVNYLMKDGKKTVAQKLLYATLALLAKKNQEPVAVFERAINTIAPKVEIKARRVGGANYQVPVEVRSERKNALAIRWLIEAARKRPSKEYHVFEEKLAAELLDAIENKGEAVKKRDNTLRQAEANKAFAHFRW